MEKIRVVMCPARRAPEIREIGSDLKSMQEAVGGYIECVTQPNGDVVICDEEGRIRAKPDNKSLPGYVGDCFICGTCGDELVSLSDNDAESWLRICERRFRQNGVRYYRRAYC